MKLIHHVKKHWKTITLHLKKHHKKYIFWILSATLLWKWVSLIAAYAVVHNLSFSFADNAIQQWDSNDEWIVIEETINNNELDDWNQEDWLWTILRWNELDNWEWDDWNNWQSTLSKDYCPDGDYSDSYYDWDCWNSEEDENHTHGSAWNEWNNSEWDNWNNLEWNEWNNLEWDDLNDWDWNDWDRDDWINLDWEWERDDWKCDRWDIEIISPIWWDIVWGTFDILREFKNDDCSDTEYTIKLRTESGQLEIFSWNSENTWFSFDSTQLESDYYSWYNLMIYGNNTIYREEEWGDFTIDNKAPVLSNTWVRYSTRNNKLNIWDTVTVSFESDEELSWVTVNIQWRTAYLEEKDWNKYKYTMEFSESNTTGKVVYWIDYSDIVWNTWYYERYDNKELDYTAPVIENINMTKSWNEIRLTINTDEITDAYLVYMISWAKSTNSLESNSKTGHEFVLNSIRNKLVYNYSISMEDEAKNKLNIWWDFYISWDKVIFTNKEIRAGDLITEAWFKSWDEQELKDKLNSFDKCSEDIKFTRMNLPIDWMTWKLVMPSFSNSSINQMTNAFTTLLVKRIDGKAFSQKDLDEIFEDLNNFLIVVKLVKDDNNACKQNMSQYYINRFKKTLIKYKLINN